MDIRHNRVKWGSGQARSRTSIENWKKPKKWNRDAEGAIERPRVFCASLADWLDDEVPIEWLTDLIDLIQLTPNLDWLLLTKRPENWYKRLSLVENEMAESWIDCIDAPERGDIPNNVWVGVSTEDQSRWDERMPLLNRIPAYIRFVSAEPLLGEIQMGDIRPDWLIVGGESGPNARPMNPEWVHNLLDQLCDKPTDFFFKQWGGTNKKTTGRMLNGRTWDQFPLKTIKKHSVSLA